MTEPHPKIPVLDHGFVRLVDFMGGDISIVRAARVSYDAAWRAGTDKGSDERLINYLWQNGHTSPFESVTLTFEVKAPIFVLRQWHRHRTQSYNELSARYRPLPDEFYVPEADQIGKQHSDNKQMRTEEQHPEAEIFRAMMSEQNAAAFRAYEKLLTEGCPRELARSVLPVATYSHMFTTMNLLNLFRFLSERLHPHAQWEIRQYAHTISVLAKSIAPIAVAAFNKNLEF